MPQKVHRPLLALVVISVLAVLLGLIVFRSEPPPSPALPSPNGYDDFVKASELITLSAGDYFELDHDGLRAWLSSNAEPLRLLREGLDRQCVIPTGSAQPNMNWLSAMKMLAQLLRSEGRLREMENRPGDAARSYADAIRFGNEMSRGGVFITRLVGISCEAIGCRPLAQIVPKLNREDSRIILSELEKLDAARVTWEEVKRNEKYSYSGIQADNRSNPITHVMSWWQTRQALHQGETKHKFIVAQERLVAGELALRCFQLEKGHPPARLDEGVTNYLSRVPQDPFTGRPMIYRSQGTNWLLYSVGPDGRDDGGSQARLGARMKGDIRFDSSW